MSKTSFKNYDLSTINSGEDFAPRPARDPAEIERRRAMKGTEALVLEQQQLGIDMMIEMLRGIEDPNDQAKAAQLAAGNLLNTAWYLLDLGGQDVMRRTLKLPVLADESGWRENPQNYELKVYNSLQEASEYSAELAELKANRLPVGPLARKLGRMIGNSALKLSVFPQIRISPEQHHVDIQAVVRESAIMMHQKARESSERLGINLSAAHFADTLSPQGVEIQTKAPDPIAAAYLRAAEVALAA